MLSESLKYSLVRFPVAFTAHQHPNLPGAALYHPFGISIRVYARCQGIVQSYEKQICFPGSHQKNRCLRFSQWKMQLDPDAFDIWCSEYVLWLQSLFYFCNTERKKVRTSMFWSTLLTTLTSNGPFQVQVFLNGCFRYKIRLIWQLRGPLEFVLPVKMCNG